MAKPSETTWWNTSASIWTASRQYSELEEEWKAEKASLSGTQTIKAELEQAKIAIEQARRVGD
ncbi:hypothetical protein MJI20_31365, partial [Salmonella enterica subsp. enterica serovar Anatum]|nr:hypothetical protein [Salmonella enterica subsp. enterica serovar Anatum]